MKKMYNVNIDLNGCFSKSTSFAKKVASTILKNIPLYKNTCKVGKEVIDDIINLAIKSGMIIKFTYLNKSEFDKAVSVFKTKSYFNRIDIQFHPNMVSGKDLIVSIKNTRDELGCITFSRMA